MVSAYSMGKEKRPEVATSKFAKHVPGPGTHQPGEKGQQPVLPKWSFGSGQRAKLQTTATKDLGPG